MANKRKSPIGQRAGNCGWIWPESTPPVDGDTCTQGCILVGLDTNDDDTHKHYDRRVKEPIPEHMIKAMMVARPQDLPVIDLARIPGSHDQFWVTRGRKRVLTMREVNRRLIAAGEPPRKMQMRVDSSDDSASVHTAKMQENICRVDPSYLDELGYIESLIGAGYTVRDIAERAGKSQAWVNDRLKLKNCCKELAAAIDARKIGLQVAKMIASKPDDEQAALVDKLLNKVTSTATGAAAPDKPVPINTAMEAVGKWIRPGTKKLRRLREGGSLHPAVAEFIEWMESGKAPSSEHGLVAALEVLNTKAPRTVKEAEEPKQDSGHASDDVMAE